MRRRRAWIAWAAVAVGGCCEPTLREPPAKFYHGQTDSIDVVVQRANANALRVPSLWTQLSYTAQLVDPEHKRTTDVSGEGSLMYRRPTSLRLAGSKDVAGDVFQLGCDGDEFWCKFRTAVDTSDYWWGHLANVGRPGTRKVPIRPDLVVEVLGVGLMSTNLLEQPTPVMRFDNEQDAYVLAYNVRRPDRWVTQKEVWYDRQSALPRRVSLYDDAGRLVLRAELSNAQPIATEGVPVDRQPRVARTFDLWFPDTGSRMTLTLADPAITHEGRRGVVLPNDASFRRPEVGGDREIQVDAGVGG